MSGEGTERKEEGLTPSPLPIGPKKLVCALIVSLLFIPLISSCTDGITVYVDVEPRPEIGFSVTFGDDTVCPAEEGSDTVLTITNQGADGIDIWFESNGGQGLLINGEGWEGFNDSLGSGASCRINLSGLSPEGPGTEIWAVAGEVEGSDWTTFQGDSHRTGVTSEEGPTSEEVKEVWSENMGAGMYSSLVLADDVIYAVNGRGNVSAVNASDGTVIWSECDIGPDNGFEVSTPVYADGMLYIAFTKNRSDDGFSLFALNASDGSVLWSKRDFNSGYAQPNTPLTYEDGLIYLGTWTSSSPGSYYCIDAVNGSMVWSREASGQSGYYWAGASVIGDYLVYGDTGGNLTSVERMTGETADEVYLGDLFNVTVSGIQSSISCSEDGKRIFVTDLGGCCFSLTFETETGVFNTEGAWSTYIGSSSSTPSVYGDSLYVGTGDAYSAGKMVSLNASDGRIQWEFPVEGGVQSSPVVSSSHDDGDGEVYIYFTINTLRGSASCLDCDGSSVWDYTVPEERSQYILQGVVLYKGTAVFANDAGFMIALGESS